MKAHTVTVLIGCVAAVAVVAATDKLFKQIHKPTNWACITDMECQLEEKARTRGERCMRVSNKLFCYRPKETKWSS